MANTIQLYTHPDYEGAARLWHRIRVLYTGDEESLVKPEFLIYHELEYSSKLSKTPIAGQQVTVGERLRFNRARRSWYTNLMEPVVSTFGSLTFQGGIFQDEEVTKLLGPAIDDIDGKGTTFHNFIKDVVATTYFRDGKVILLVDAPSVEVRSRAEERAVNFRAFMEVLDVLSVKDWQTVSDTTRRGEFDFLRFEYEEVARRRSAREEPQVMTYCKEYVADGDQVLVNLYLKEDADWVPQTQIPLKLSRLPLVGILDNPSWVKDIVPLCIGMYNLQSAYYSALNSQAFQRVVMAGTGLGDKHEIAVGENAILFVPEGTTTTVIEPSDTKALEGAISRKFDEISRVAWNRSRSLAASSGEAPGAETLREQGLELNALLEQAAREIEAVVNKSLKSYAMFVLGPEKGEKFEGKIAIQTDFSSADFRESLELYLAHKDEIRQVPTWRKHYLKNVMRKQGFTALQQEEISGGIEEIPEVPQLGDFTSPYRKISDISRAGIEGVTGGKQTKNTEVTKGQAA